MVRLIYYPLIRSRLNRQKIDLGQENEIKSIGTNPNKNPELMDYVKQKFSVLSVVKIKARNCLPFGDSLDHSYIGEYIRVVTVDIYSPVNAYSYSVILFGYALIVLPTFRFCSRPMRLQKLTKKQVAEALDQQPLYEMLNVDKTSLTTKQLKFCENLARGETKAGAYRQAYNSKGKSSTMANNGHKLAKRGDIQTITEAIKQGIEFQKLYTAGQIRALVVQRLTQEAISEDSNPSVRVNALKALGTIAGVDAFMHRSETKVIKDSDKARSELMDLLKQSMSDNQRTIDPNDDDVLALMAEIAPTHEQIPAGEISDPHHHYIAEGVPSSSLHSIPLTQSPSKTNSEVIQNNPEENQ
jgi:hypothetical protein